MRIANDELTIAKINISETPGDMSSSFETDPIWLGHIVNYSIQLIFTGSPMGELKLQASNDKGLSDRGEKYFDIRDLQNWTDIDCSEETVSAAGDHMWQVENAGYRWVRVVWTPTAGTGSVTAARFNAKGV